MPSLDLPRPAELSAEHWAAVEDGLARISRAQRDSDWPAAVGAAKELCETVAKVVLASRHDEVPSDFAPLITAAHKVLARHPTQATERSMRDMAAAASKLVTPLAELRNAFGTGHGRAVVAPTLLEHAMLATDAAMTWTRWALWRLDDVLANSVDRLISDLTTGETFTRGLLAQRLQSADLDSLSDEDLMRLGRAIAHRGAHGNTFVVAEDGIEAVVSDPDRYPAALRRGLIAGLFVDVNGYVRARPQDVAKAQALAVSLGDSNYLREVAAAVEGADFSYAMDFKTSLEMAAVIAALVKSMKDGWLRDVWDRIRAKFASASE